MHSQIRLALALIAFTLPGCNCWLGSHVPQKLNPDTPITIQSQDAFPNNKVEILVDELGIPHIFGDDQNDLAYGLGYMHARERLFQITVFKYAGLGRLTELFGKDLLSADRYLRVLSIGLDAQMAAMSAEEQALLQAYVNGLNQGANDAGPSEEMSLLDWTQDVTFEPFTIRDILAIARLQQNDQSAAGDPELARSRLQNRISPTDPLWDILMVPAPSNGVPIVSATENTAPDLAGGMQPQRARTAHRLVLPPKTARLKALSHKPIDPKRQRAIKKLTDTLASLRVGGASNAWAVAPEHTQEGVATLVNDPHLGHSAPSVFYFVHMEAPDVTVVGGSFPGLPAVLIGHGRHIAWGITASFADAQDFVRLKPYLNRTDMYELDGVGTPYGIIHQTYKLGPKANAPLFEEDMRTTVFGPVLPEGWGHLFDDVDTLAYQWTAQHYVREGDHLLTAFWGLARAENVAQADEILQKFISPPMNFTMAFTNGTIAYRTSGSIPQRLSDESVLVPRNGATRAAGWGAPLPRTQKPQLTNPTRGYIVASNQRIVDDDDPQANRLGGESADPYRAMRIHQRLEEVIGGGNRMNGEALLAIQQDVHSLEAEDLAPILGAHCPSKVDGIDDTEVADFCSAISNFDANFTLDSMGALPYQFMMEAFEDSVFVGLFGEEVGLQTRRIPFAHMALHREMVKENSGTLSPLFGAVNNASRQGLNGFAAKAAAVALNRLNDDVGKQASKWRYGDTHTLTFKGQLASIPVLGGMFKTAAHQMDGCDKCVHAEGRVPVTFGSGLRMIAQMSDPPVVRIIGDTGNSGHFASKHLHDMFDRWNAGDPVVMKLSRDEIAKQLEGSIVIEPQSAATP